MTAPPHSCAQQPSVDYRHDVESLPDVHLGPSCIACAAMRGISYSLFLNYVNRRLVRWDHGPADHGLVMLGYSFVVAYAAAVAGRSEERRVGKECRRGR